MSEKLEQLKVAYDKLAEAANAAHSAGAPRSVWEVVYAAMENMEQWMEEEHDYRVE